MGMWTAIFLISTVAIIAEMIKRISDNKVKKKKSQLEEPEVVDSLKRLEELEERTKVLERIITENKYDLRSEINKL